LKEYFEILISVLQKLQKVTPQNPAHSLQTQKLIPEILGESWEKPSTAKY